MTGRHCTIIAVGALKGRDLLDLQEEYLKRLKHYCKIDVVELKESKLAEDDREKYMRELEKEITARIGPDDCIVALDREGKELDSQQFAGFVKSRFPSHKKIVFLVGGSIGLPELLKKKTAALLSFSKMTYPHKLFRIIFLEQLYRAYTIINGEKYHK